MVMGTDLYQVEDDADPWNKWSQNRRRTAEERETLFTITYKTRRQPTVSILMPGN